MLSIVVERKIYFTMTIMIEKMVNKDSSCY